MSEFSFEIKTSFVAEGLAFIHLSFMNIMTVYITNLIQSNYSVEQPTCLFCPAIYFFLEFLQASLGQAPKNLDVQKRPFDKHVVENSQRSLGLIIHWHL